MNLTVLYYAGIVIITGLFFGKLAKYVKMPNVTGYLVGGLILGPSIAAVLSNLLGFNIKPIISETGIESLKLVSSVALGFIAFSIGNELKLTYFKEVGPRPIIIAALESFFAVIFVFGGLIAYFAITDQLKGTEGLNNIQFALVLSAIAAATAPAATLMVVRQYKAKGPLTETLLSVVAIDDATAIMMFGINVAIANMLGESSKSILMQVLEPIYEIGISLVIGAIIGLILTLASKWYTGRGNRISLVIASIFLTIFLTDKVGGSTLLACMALGGLYANLYKKYDEVNGLIYFITPPIFTMFFVLSGADLDVTLLGVIGIIGIIYVLIRVFGKWFGAWFGSVITHAEPVVSKFLGYALVPQAGVAIGLMLVAQQIFTGEREILASKIQTVVLCATLIYELVGPIITKITLKAAGEITEEN